MSLLLKRIINKRWPLCCLLFFLFTCKNVKDNKVLLASSKDSLMKQMHIDEALGSIYASEKYIQQGDLIMRTGKDFTSEIFRHLSLKDNTYSHCGIASIEHDTIFVYHSIGGQFNPDQKLRRDPYELFCNPFENRGFGIFRYTLYKPEVTKLTGVIQQYYRQEIMFDMDFNLESNDRMYCTEFVYKAVKQATNNKIQLPVTNLNQHTFIAPDNLFINNYCTNIKKVLFKP